MKHTSKFTSMVAAALVSVAALSGLHLGTTPALAQSGDKAGDKGKEKSPEALDQLIFRNGNKVEGKILSETETTITVRVMFAGISSETVYQKAEILEIKRGAIKVAPKADDAKSDEGKGDEKAPDAAASKADEDDGKIVDKDGKAIPADNLKVYYIPLKGEFGRDLSFPSLEKMVDDIVRIQPDVLIFKFDFNFALNGQSIDEYHHTGNAAAWNYLETATDMAELLFRKLDSGAFKTKPRTVAWVKKALGGSAFLPCAFQEIYFTPDGLHGGIGGLEALAKGVGDEVAQEKQRSLRMARARGLAELGGHDGRFLEAMTRRDYWLSYKLEGGEVILSEKRPETPDWIVLKDDGTDDRADSAVDRMRMQGNDYLTFNARNAQTLGWSKGTAETMDDLLFKMGITRNFSVVKTKAEKILKGRSDEIRDAEKQLAELVDRYQSIRLKAPGGYKERTAERGQRISLLKQMIAIIKRYRNEMNPRAIPNFQYGDPEVTLRAIELAQRNDRP